MSVPLKIASVIVTDDGTIDASAISVAFANIGAASAVVNGIALGAGQTVKFGGYGNCRLPSIAYDATGTSLRIDYEHVA